MNERILKHAVVRGENIKEITSNISTLFDWNEDFNGGNGEEYLSEEAKEAGFPSNMEYVESFICGKFGNFLNDSVVDVLDAYIEKAKELDSMRVINMVVTYHNEYLENMYVVSVIIEY